MTNQRIMVILMSIIPLQGFGQVSDIKSSRLSNISRTMDSSSIIFTELPEEELFLTEDDEIPAPFDVKAMTTCSIGSSDPVEEPGSAEQYEVGTYDQLITTLNLVQHGDVIQLINDITIKPDNTFPNHLGVWEPFVFNKSITIDGGTTQF